ncbi:MAG: hypothetical protein QXM08_00650 [Thermofilaceae archaeon]
MELPKLSQFTRVLATPEEYFERAAKSSLNIELPPGPMSMLLKLQTALETGEAPRIERVLPAIRPPGLQEILASIPKLPELPAPAEAAPAPVTVEKRPVTVEKREAVVF